MGCERGASPAEPATTTAVSATTGHEVGYDALRVRIAEERDRLAADLARATSDATRRVVLAQAREALRRAIVEQLFPAWMGTRWAFHGTTERPRGPEGIACGWFVATILAHAGLRLESRRRFGQATALAIAKALVPAKPAHHRVFSVPAQVLEQKLRSFGEGLYVLGLDCHVGFVSVRASAARVIHASYTGRRVVVDEPIVASEVIDRSRAAGYFATSLFADDGLARAWLAKTTIVAPRA